MADIEFKIKQCISNLPNASDTKIEIYKISGYEEQKCAQIRKKYYADQQLNAEIEKQLKLLAKSEIFYDAVEIIDDEEVYFSCDEGTTTV